MSQIFRLIFIIVDAGLSIYILLNSVKAMLYVKKGEASLQDLRTARKTFYTCARIGVVTKLFYWLVIPYQNNSLSFIMVISLLCYLLVFLAALFYTLPLHIFSNKFKKTNAGVFFAFIFPPIVMTIVLFFVAWLIIAPIV